MKNFSRFVFYYHPPLVPPEAERPPAAEGPPEVELPKKRTKEEILAARSETAKEIYKEAAENRRALRQSKVTDKLISKDRLLLKEDTNILISQKGKGSKHNIAGWKGMVFKDDKVEILDKHMVKIKGKDYVKAKAVHHLGKYRPDKAGQYRTYVGYIEASAFEDNLRTSLLPTGPFSIGEKSETPVEALKPDVIDPAKQRRQLELARVDAKLRKELFADIKVFLKRHSDSPAVYTLTATSKERLIQVKNRAGFLFEVKVDPEKSVYIVEDKEFKQKRDVIDALQAYIKANPEKLTEPDK